MTLFTSKDYQWQECPVCPHKIVLSVTERYKGLPVYQNLCIYCSCILILVRRTSKSKMTITYAHKVKFTNVHIFNQTGDFNFRLVMLEELEVSLSCWQDGGEASTSWCIQSKSISLTMIIFLKSKWHILNCCLSQVSDLDHTLHDSKLSLQICLKWTTERKVWG